jgi:hypothetical protein
MEMTQSGILYMNPHPELTYIHAMQPAVKCLSESEFLCIYKHGSALESVDSTLAQIRSVDGGRTWVSEGFLVPPTPNHSSGFSYFCPHLTKLADGRLILLSVRFKRDDPGLRCYNPLTGGCLQPDTTLFISDDNGVTWEGPKVVDIQGRYAYSGGPVVELSDGRLMVIMETWKPYEDDSPIRTHIFAMFSADNGNTWKDETLVFSDPKGKLLLWDMVYKKYSDDSLGTFAWSHDPNTSKDLHHHRIISHDNGLTWSKPEPTNRHGQFNVTQELPDGRLLGIYNLRNVERPGIYACLSNDQGRTWDIDNRLQLWDALSGSRIGSTTGTTFLDDLATFAFGKSDIDLIDEHTALVAFWATQSCITHVRWCKIHF